MSLKLILLLSLIAPALCYYAKHYRKCKLSYRDKFDFSNAKIERVPEYDPDFSIPTLVKTSKEIEYEPLNFIYNQYVSAGASGQVYFIEDLNTSKVRVVKRYFIESKQEFQRQNFVINEMSNQVKWHKEDNDMNKSTLTSYPSQQSISLKNLGLDNPNDIAAIFYKICQELAKAHRKGFIHHDIKMENILIKSVGVNLKIMEASLIDWNLVSFYSIGYQSQDEKGTKCLNSPQTILGTAFPTPALDVWSLAVDYFNFIFDAMPFSIQCNVSPLEAILTLVGSERFLEVYEKYQKASAMEVSLIEEIKANRKLFEGISLSDRIPDEYAKHFDDQLLDLLAKMLEVDPEYRLTITEVLNHPYFDRVKRLPKMYEEKNKRKKASAEKPQKHAPAPANNLVPPPEYFQ